MEEKVLDTIKKNGLIKKGDIIVIGVSGGPDSICLLNVLYNLQKQLEIKIIVAHINHQIREEAKIETEYVKEFCEKRQIKCHIKYVDVVEISKQRKISTEEAGRDERYKYFEEISKIENANKIATAHNENDKVETVLMNIIRGTGISGLKGIEPKRNNKIIRPLIEIKRKDIEEYCKKNRLEPKYDKSNQENIYTRNKVRNMLIPYLEENFNPNIIDAINKLSDLANGDNEFIEKQVKDVYNEILVEKNKDKIQLDLKKFNKLDVVIKNRLIMYTISKVLGTAKDIEKKHIADIVKLCSNNIGNKYLTPKKNIKVSIKNKKIFFEKVA